MLLLPCTKASDTLNLPVAKHWVKNIFPLSLPHEIRSLWLYNYAREGAQGRIYFYQSDKNFCAYLGNDRKYPELPLKKNKTLRININCFRNVDSDDINSEKNSNVPSDLKKDLIAAAVTQWGLNERPQYQDEKQKNYLFEHDFFDSPWSLGVDIDGPHYLIDFYSKTIYQYLTNKDLWKNEPFIYGFIRDNIYNKLEFFYSTYNKNCKDGKFWSYRSARPQEYTIDPSKYGEYVDDFSRRTIFKSQPRYSSHLSFPRSRDKCSRNSNGF